MINLFLGDPNNKVDNKYKQMTDKDIILEISKNLCTEK